ncbi:cell adhesion molecule Dscam1-like [Centruroides vittatus]|uniref:cell adhesion molecule Dscam1-like n=1 Tax=Centruroides vittatus TaxID=120091 RepID=UPI0035107B40
MSLLNITILLYLIITVYELDVCYSYQGPKFVREPPNRVVFLNTTGTIISCLVKGNPMPTVTWVKRDDTLISDLPGLRHVKPEGSLVFPPFQAEDYRQDVHDTVYKCLATSSVGKIVSREVQVRGVVLQDYQAHVYDEFVIRGNTAVLKCQVPAFVKEFMVVSSWTREDGLVILPRSNPDTKYLMIHDGELHIRNADRADSLKKYECNIRNILSGEDKKSSTTGQLIVTDPTGSIPPRITNGRLTVETFEERAVELPCAAQGYPVPIYRWYKNEDSQLIPVHLGERMFQIDGTLFISRTIQQDSGKYVCVVSNNVGEERTETVLSVKGNLSVWLHPDPLTVEAGRSVTFNCSIAGYPINSVIWLKDQRHLLPNTRIRLISNRLLHITSVQRSDQGMYQCFVYNEWQSAQGTAQLTLSEDAPHFSFTFSKKILAPGRRLALRCTAIGNPLPRVTWTLDNKAIPENHRVQYGDFVSVSSEVVSFVNISSVMREDGGVYQCKAQNDAGYVVHAERIDIIGPPYIRPMGNITVVAKETLLYRCPVSGYPTPSVIWKKDGRELPLNERQQVFSNGTLILNDIARETDEGTYTCLANNKKGEETRADLIIRVTKKPVINSFSFPNVLAEGMRVIATCNVLTGDPPITIRWLKDEFPLNRESLNVEESSLRDFGSSLVFNSVGRSHNGNYTCVASNEAGTTNYTAAMVVNVPPRWKIEPTDMSVVVGDLVIFDCQAEGYPPPLIRWKKAIDETSKRNFKSIISNYHIQTLENGSLSINNVEIKDSGQYLCEITNGFGAELSTVVRLSVHVAAHFKTNFLVQRVPKGSVLTIQAEAYGERPINIEWRKDKVYIKSSVDTRYIIKENITTEGLQSVLTVNRADRKDSGVYSCLAANAYGKDELKIQVLVEEPPDPPTDVRATDVNSRSATLRWNVVYIGNSPIEKFFVEWKLASESWTSAFEKEISGSNMTMVINNLRPVTNYHFRVYASNALGKSSPSDVHSLTTEEEVPSLPPTNLEATPLNSHSIRVSWKPPPSESTHGNIRGYYVGYKVFNSAEQYLYKTLEVYQEANIHYTLLHLRKATKYGIIVQAFNSKGTGPPTKEIVVKTYENDPPSTPVLRISSSSSSSVVLSWEIKRDNPINGYTILYKQENGQWEEMDVPGDQLSYTLQNLQCGTRYQFYMYAYNEIGKSDHSDITSVTTLGGAPVAPDKKHLLYVNTTSVLVKLNAWHNGGCPISSFTIQYKQRGQREWTLVSNSILPVENNFLLPGLQPATRYNLLMSAHNEAGTTEAEFVFGTLTLTGATLSPALNEGNEGTSFYKNLSIIIPIVCAIVVLLVITVVVLIACVKKSRNSEYGTTSQESDRRADPKGDSISMASVGKKLYETPREPLYYPSPYATTRISMYSGDSESSSGQTNSLQRHVGNRPEHTYDVPFPPKQFCNQTRCSSVSHDYQTVFADGGQYLTASDNRQDPTKSHRINHEDRHERYQTHRITEPTRRHNSMNNSRDTYTDSGSEDDSNSEEMAKRHFTANATDNHEMSEAECDRDYHCNLKKGKNASQFSFVKLRFDTVHN